MKIAVFGATGRPLVAQALERGHVTDAMEESGADRFVTLMGAAVRTEDDLTGDYRTGDIELGMESVARADVADFALDCVGEDLYVRELPKIGS